MRAITGALITVIITAAAAAHLVVLFVVDFNLIVEVLSYAIEAR